MILVFLLTMMVVLATKHTEGACLLFQMYNNVTGQCTCPLESSPPGYNCRQQSTDIGSCATYDNSTGIASSGNCPYELDLTGNISLDAKNIVLMLTVHTGEELNKVMCGPLNREGLLCGRCKPGYGVAVYSKTFKCVKCDKSKVWMWLVYILLETVPSTLLYFVIIIFNMRATAPPITSFLFHCQFLSFAYTIPVFKVLIGYKANPTLLWFTMTVLDIWNLDALRHLVPLFCVSSSLTNFQVQVTRLVATLYPLFLVSASYIFIELHARNCKLIVLLWKPFHRCFAHFRRKWDPRSSNITAFSTLVVISLLKLWFASLYTVYHGLVRSNNTSASDVYALYIDPYMLVNTCLDLPVPLVCGLTVIVLITVIMPILTLCLYPTRICKKIFCRAYKSQTLRLFVETFQGHYKDGTNGTRDYRAVASLVFILRVSTVLTIYPINPKNGLPSKSPAILMVYTLIFTAFFYAIVQPYKKRNMNCLESILYAFAGLSFLFIITSNLKAHTVVDLRPLSINVFLAVQLLPSVALVGKLVHKIAFGNLSILRMKLKNNDNAAETDELPDRIVHPNEYTPLL